MDGLDRREFLSAVGLGLAVNRLAGEYPGEPGVTSSRQIRMGPDPWLELDSGALHHNLAAIREQVGDRPVMAVIKGNGYGHGLLEIGRMLQEEGIQHLAVAKVSEALALRNAGIEGTILNFGPFASGEVAEIVRGRITQTVFTDQVRELAEEALKSGITAQVHVNIDTGLGRVGVGYREALDYLRMISSTGGIRVEGVFTAFTEEPEFDRVQLNRFLEICESARREGIGVGVRHAASSAALMDFPEAFLDMIRPGIAVYGHYPSSTAWKERSIDLDPVLSLKTRVVYVKKLAAGDSLSYHRAFVAQQPTRVATLPIGYSDGYPWAVAGKADVLIRGRRFPIIAIVTANHVLVDIGEDRQVSIGDEAVLVGRQGSELVDGHLLSEAAGFSVYKLLIGMKSSLPRIIT